MVLPAGLEARRAADAFEFGDLIEESRDESDEHGEGREPVLAGRGISVLERSCFDLHGRDYTRAGRPAGLRGLDPTFFARKWLRVLELGC